MDIKGRVMLHTDIIWSTIKTDNRKIKAILDYKILNEN